MIDIRLERRRHPEVVHRKSEHEDIGALELIDQRIGVLDDRLLLDTALARLGQECAEAFGVEMRHHFFREIADDDFRAGVARAPGGDKFVGELGRLAVARKDTGVDLQQSHGSPPRYRCNHSNIYSTDKKAQNLS